MCIETLFFKDFLQWENEVLSTRVRDYQPEWLDGLCLSGQISWLRLAPPATAGPAVRARATSRSTPLSLVLREDLGWLLEAHRAARPNVEEVGARAQSILDLLKTRGALFHSELVAALRDRPGDGHSLLLAS